MRSANQPQYSKEAKGLAVSKPTSVLNYKIANKRFESLCNIETGDKYRRRKWLKLIPVVTVCFPTDWIKQDQELGSQIETTDYYMEIAASKPAFQNEPASQLSFNEVCCHRIDMNLGVSLFRAARGSLYPMICSLQPSKSCGTPQSEGSSTEISTLFVKVPGRHVLCP